MGRYFDREITEEQYLRGLQNRGNLTDADARNVLTEAERFGYGATAGRVKEKDGKFYCSVFMYDSCD